MAYVKTGFLRSFSVEVTKKINGVVQAGYPKTYPTALDVSNGYFTYNGTQYSIPTANALALMDSSTYQNLLAMLKLYAVSLEPGLNWETATVITAAEYYDPVTCIPGQGTTTTTTLIPPPTTTTAAPPTTTVAPVVLYPFCARVSDDLSTHCAVATRIVVWVDSQYFSAPHHVYLDAAGTIHAADSYKYIDCTFGAGDGIIYDFNPADKTLDNAVGTCVPDLTQQCPDLMTTTTTAAPATTTTAAPTTTTTTADPGTSYPFCVRLSLSLETHCDNVARTIVYGDRAIFAPPTKLYFDAERTLLVRDEYNYVDVATEGDIYDMNVDGSLNSIVGVCTPDVSEQCTTTTTTVAPVTTTTTAAPVTTTTTEPVTTTTTTTP